MVDAPISASTASVYQLPRLGDIKVWLRLVTSATFFKVPVFTPPGCLMNSYNLPYRLISTIESQPSEISAVEPVPASSMLPVPVLSGVRCCGTPKFTINEALHIPVDCPPPL